jgi:hypothetical protein
MSLGASIVLFAIGAILTWGVNVQTNGLDLDAVGVILMVVGIIGGLISALFLASWSPYPYRRSVVHERRVVDDPVERVHVREVRRDPYVT